MARSRPLRPRRTWPQRLLLVANVVLVVACLGAALSLTTIRSTIEEIPVVDIGSSLSPAAEISDPRNFLIIGTDSAAGFDSDDPRTKGRNLTGELADVIMILRVDPRDGSAQLLSIPRDTRASIAPSGSMARINSAISAGGDEGPRNLVQTINRNFGIPIDHYVEIDFKSFTDLVDVLGGVPVYFTTPVRDQMSGLFVEEPGCVMLGPDQALAYARSRAFQYQTERGWQTDGSGDLGRITRQQDFIKRALRRASDQGIRNPSTAVGVVNAGVASVRMDDTLDVGTILTLLREFQSFNPEDLASAQVPTVYDPRGGVDYQSVVWSEAEELLAPFWGVDPGAPVEPRNVIVDVRGRSEAEPLLEAIADQLDAAGFDADVNLNRSRSTRTAITYGPRGRDAAVRLAAQLEVVPEFIEDDDIRGFRVELEIGTDFGGVRGEAVPVESLPAELLPPATTLPEQPEVTGPEVTGPEVTGPEVPSDAGTDPAGDPAGSLEPPLNGPPGVVPVDPERAATCR